jgi:hypothetical protein
MSSEVCVQRWACRQESDKIVITVILNHYVGYNIQGRTVMASIFWSFKKKQKRDVKQ